MTYFSVSAPSSAAQGSSFSVTVTAETSANTTATGYTGTVHFSSSDGSATLPANATLTSGVGTFNVTLQTTGTQSVVATDTATSSITGSASVLVTPPATLAIASVEGNSTAGGTVTVDAGTVEAVVATDFLASGSTVFIYSSNPTALLGQAVYTGSSTGPGTVTIPVTFAYFGIYTITASDSNVPADVSPSVTVIETAGPARPASYFVVSAPSSASADSPINFTVTAYNSGNTVATGYSGTVAFTSSDPSAAMPANATLSNGTGSFSATLETPGVQTITATDTVTTSITGTSAKISVSNPNLAVNTTGDTTSGVAGDCTPQATATSNSTDKACSLRDALAWAAANTSEPVSIGFDATVFATAQTISLANVTLSIPSNTTINGPSIHSVAVNGNNAVTVFSVAATVTNATIRNLTITGGLGAGNGGGIQNLGSLTVANSNVSGNSATGTSAAFGGGIFNSGTFTLTGSTVSGNVTSASDTYGAGIYNVGGTVTISDSTISGNAGFGTETSGGGVFDNSGAMTITNSTISGNTAELAAGYYTNGGYDVFTNVTISANVASLYYGGLDNSSSTVTLANTIVSGNTAPTGNDINGGFTDYGGNQVGTPVSLASLANYGGLTLTMMPLIGSPAICGGLLFNATQAGITTDQRGNPLDPHCAAGEVDSGAVQTAYKTLQTISFPAITEPVYVGGTVALSAAATSGLAVSYVSVYAAAGICTVTNSGGVWSVNLLAAGSCSIEAQQWGNGTYQAAPFVFQNFYVHTHSNAQTITFPAITEPVYVDGTVTPAATASSGLPVSYVSVHPSICTVSSSGGVWTINLIAVGECSVEAQQGGSSTYAGAPFAFQNFYVHPTP